MRSRVPSLLAVLLAFGMSSCSSSQPADDSAGPPPSAPTAPTAPTGSAEPTGPSAPAVPVATGAVRTISEGGREFVSYRLPTEEWRASASSADAGSLLTPEGASYTISGSALVALTGSDLASYQQTALDLADRSGPKLSASPDRTLDGVEGYVVEGDDRSGRYYQFGTIYEDRVILLTFDFPAGGSRSEEWIEAVLASVKWQ